jgi:hypothetical protein
MPQLIAFPKVKNRSGWQGLSVHGAVFAKPSTAHLTIWPERDVGAGWDLNVPDHKSLRNLT